MARDRRLVRDDDGDVQRVRNARFIRALRLRLKREQAERIRQTLRRQGTLYV